MHAAQVLLTSHDLSVRMHYLNARQALRRMLEWRAVPVVNENDTTATDEITFGDNDFLSAQLALLLGRAAAGPAHRHRRAAHGRPQPRPVGRAGSPPVDDFAELDAYEIGDRTSLYGSGGMRSKVSAAGMASAAGIPAAICDGTARGLAARGGPRRRLSGRGSSPIPSARRRSSSGCATRSRRAGGCVVDAGAARVLRESGSSLLPVGIVGVEGEFDAGDAVDVVCDGDAGSARGSSTTLPPSS